VSLRSPVGRIEIEAFLRRLGEQHRGMGRIYLVGGTSLVYEGFRQQTLDADLAFGADVQNLDHLIQTIRILKDQLDINVEEASPSDFIPLPAGYSNRHVYIGRFGQLDVFHFDWYSTALSKIARGREQDYHDVLSLLQQAVIDWDTLRAQFHEILPQVGQKSLRQNPDEFEANFSALAALWRTAGGQP
jgi:hypothetical protein